MVIWMWWGIFDRAGCPCRMRKRICLSLWWLPSKVYYRREEDLGICLKTNVLIFLYYSIVVPVWSWICGPVTITVVNATEALQALVTQVESSRRVQTWLVGLFLLTLDPDPCPPQPQSLASLPPTSVAFSSLRGFSMGLKFMPSSALPRWSPWWWSISDILPHLLLDGLHLLERHHARWWSLRCSSGCTWGSGRPATRPWLNAAMSPQCRIIFLYSCRCSWMQVIFLLCSIHEVVFLGGI